MRESIVINYMIKSEMKMKYNPQIHHRRSIRLKGYDYSQAGLYFITICTQNRACLFGDVRRGESMGEGSPNQHSPVMVLNDAGKMIKHWYDELGHKFTDIKCHAMIIMPNHIHFIIENTGFTASSESFSESSAAVVRANLCVRPDGNRPNGNLADILPNGNRPDEDATDIRPNGNITGNGNILGNGNAQCNGNILCNENILCKNDILENKNIGGEQNQNILGEQNKNILGEHIGSPLRDVIRWFKTMTTNNYIRGVKQNDWTPFDGKLWQRNYYEHIIRDDRSFQNISDYIHNNPAKWNVDKLK